MSGEINFFAKTNFRNQEKIFGIKKDDRRRHMYVIGKTGMGKTNLLETLAIQDIRCGRGLAFIDPHGDTAEKILKAIPKDRINDVIYFNPADTAYPIAFNPMENVNEEQRNLVADGIFGVFKKIWENKSWGPRLEYVLMNSILALMEMPDSTLLGVLKMLSNEEYRNKVVQNVTDPVVREFWSVEYKAWSDRDKKESVAPIQNKVGQFITSYIMRNVLGQPRSAFNVREAMDNQKILIMNLSKGRIGEENSALLGAMMITKIQVSAMARVDTPEEERKDFYLYVDEFQNFSTESFVNILSEARKYRLCLILANQYIEQITLPVRNAIFGNCGTITSFRVGAKDAERLVKELGPPFGELDYCNLDKYSIYIRLMINGLAGDAFSAKTLEPFSLRDTEKNAEKIIKVSRERYGNPRETIEEKISRWVTSSGSGTRKQPTTRVRKEIKAKGGAENHSKSSGRKRRRWKTRPSFDAKCSICGVQIQVRFEPDGVRPAFCRECFKDYQRVRDRQP